MINRIKLQDGKLYESVDGERFRVKWSLKLHRFECLAANQAWGDDGVPVRASNPDGYIGRYLVREVQEYRWVPVRGNDTLGLAENEIFRMQRGHIQRRVTRDEARRLAPNYKPQEQVLTKREQLGAAIESVRQGGKDFLRITTPSGKVVIVEV